MITVERWPRADRVKILRVCEIGAVSAARGVRAVVGTSSVYPSPAPWPERAAHLPPEPGRFSTKTAGRAAKRSEPGCGQTCRSCRRSMRTISRIGRDGRGSSGGGGNAPQAAAAMRRARGGEACGPIHAPSQEPIPASFGWRWFRFGGTRSRRLPPRPREKTCQEGRRRRDERVPVRPAEVQSGS